MRSIGFWSGLIPFLGLAVYFGRFLYDPILLRLNVLGFTRVYSHINNIHGSDLQVDGDLPGCEDIHFHAPSRKIYGAADTQLGVKDIWFPPAEVFGDLESVSQGQIFVLDPVGKSKVRLRLEGFQGPLIPHGIDIYSPLDQLDHVYIFVINHLRNPAHAVLKDANVPKARSQIEVFLHVTNESHARWLRSVVHPLLRTPNDIYAINERELYVTNDHFHREGLGRASEDLGWAALAPWSDIIHIKIDDLETRGDSTGGISASKALTSIANPNGLGHGRSDDEVLLGHASSGNLSILHRSSDDNSLRVVESFQAPNTIDNPSYFHDPFASETKRDASGFVLAGLHQAVYILTSKPLSSVVWLIDQHTGEKRKIFQDDGKLCHSASTAILLPIAPNDNGGKKQAWLFVTGPWSRGLVSTRIDL